MEQSDRLLALWSSKFPTIDHDFGVPIRKKLRGAAGKILHRQIDRTREVTRRIGFSRQHIDERYGCGLQALLQLLAGYFRDVQGSFVTFSYRCHLIVHVTTASEL